MAEVSSMRGTRHDLRPAVLRQPCELLSPVSRAERITLATNDEEWAGHPRHLALERVVHRRPRHAGHPHRAGGEVVPRDDRNERWRLSESVDRETGCLPHVRPP